jgi:hypothetical protein
MNPRAKTGRHPSDVNQAAFDFGYRLADVNDGACPHYQQSSPKARVLALLDDMIKAGY